MSSTKVALPNRMNFGKVKHLAATPDLLEIQIQSFKDFFQLETTPDKRNNEGLFKVFKENFPDYRYAEHLRAGISGLFH